MGESGEERTERWIESYLRPRFPALEAEFRDTWAAYRYLRETRAFDAGRFAQVERAAYSTNGALWNNATDWLRALAEPFPVQVCDVLSRMSRSKESHARFNALCAVGPRTPRALAVEMILRGISDRNGEVRWKAVEKARQLNLTEAVPFLEKRREVEKSAKVLGVIDLELPLLRDGYDLKPDGDGFLLTIANATRVSSEPVTREELRRRTIEEIAEERRDRMDRGRA